MRLDDNLLYGINNLPYCEFQEPEGQHSEFLLVNVHFYACLFLYG